MVSVCVCVFKNENGAAFYWLLAWYISVYSHQKVCNFEVYLFHSYCSVLHLPLLPCYYKHIKIILQSLLKAPLVAWLLLVLQCFHCVDDIFSSKLRISNSVWYKIILCLLVLYQMSSIWVYVMMCVLQLIILHDASLEMFNVKFFHTLNDCKSLLSHIFYVSRIDRGSESKRQL